MTPARKGPPRATHILTLHVDVDPAIAVQSTERGTSMFIPIVGGRASGPGLNAEIMRGGGDWAVDRRSGEFNVHARYHLCTDDGVVIGVDNVGIWLEQPGAPPYFVTAPRFDAPRGRYEWMTRAVFVGIARERSAERIDIAVFHLDPTRPQEL
jgi:hypothetical protein